MAPRQSPGQLATCMASPPCPGPTRRPGAAGGKESASGGESVTCIWRSLPACLVAVVAAQDQQEALTDERQHVGIARSRPLALDYLRPARGVTGTVSARGRAQCRQEGALCAPRGASAASQPGPGQTSRRWRARRGRCRPAAGVASDAGRHKNSGTEREAGQTRLHDHHTPHSCGRVSRSRRGRLSQRRQLAPGARGHVEAVHIRRGAGESNTRGGSAAGGVLKCGRTPKQDQPLGGVAHARSEGVAAARERRIR